MILETVAEIRRAAMDLLARREHSRLELWDKLTSKGCDANLLEGVLQQLQVERLQSDERFVEMYVHHRAEQGYGPQHIAQELQARGIDTALIEQHLAATLIAWQEVLTTVWQKKFRSQPPADYNEKAKQVRFLQYRGFELQHIMDLFDSL